MSICGDDDSRLHMELAKTCTQVVDAGQDVCDVSSCRDELKLPCENPSQKKRIKGILRNIASGRDRRR